MEMEMEMERSRVLSENDGEGFPRGTIFPLF